MSKIVAVTGATGVQGGSVARVLLESGGDWKVRAVTRNPNGEAAKALAAQGAEVVSANFDDEGSVVKAFEGAYAVFAVTNFWEHLFSGKTQDEAGAAEEAQAMTLARASAQTVSLQHFIWSTIPSATELTGLSVPHMDYKARVDGRIRDELPELFAKTTFLSVGFYSSNFAYFPLLKPVEVPGSGKYAWLVPSKPSATIPQTGDVSVTVGVWTRQVLANPQKTLGGKYATVATETLSFGQMLDVWGEVTGKQTVYVETSLEAYEGIWGIPGREVAQQFAFGERVKDWYGEWAAEGKFVTKEELGIKAEEVSGFREALEKLKGLLL